MKPMMICPMVTAFTEDGLIDNEANAKQIDRLIDQGVGAILFLGSIGEFSTMSLAQKEAMLQFAIPYVNHRVRTLAGLACPAIEDTVHLSEVAKAVGADAALVLPPYYFAADQETAYIYFTDLAARIALPFMIYNFPANTGINLSADTIRRLAQDCPKIIGIKDTVDSISHCREVVAAVRPVCPDFEIYSGYDDYALLNLVLGGNGAICGMNNLIPEVFRSLRDAFLAGDYAAANEAQRRIFAIMPVYQATPSFVQAIKVMVAKLIPGYPTNMRIPSHEPTPQQEETLDTLMKNTILAWKN